MATATSLHQNTFIQKPSIVAAWIDQSIGETGMHKYIKERFESLSPFIKQWLYFSSSDDFIRYIEINPEIKMICVMSGGMSRLLVAKYSHLPVLYSIYVFCVDIERAKASMINEMKVKGIFNIEDDLYEQMVEDLSKLLVEEGVALARLDERSLARLYYEEAKRLLSIEAKRIDLLERNSRTQEIDMRLDQLLA